MIGLTLLGVLACHAPSDLVGTPPTVFEGFVFEADTGGVTDLAPLSVGCGDGPQPVPLDVDGTLRIGPGCWSVELEVTADVTILGSGAELTELSGDDSVTVVRVLNGGNARLEHLSITHGLGSVEVRAAIPTGEFLDVPAELGAGGLVCMDASTSLAHVVLREHEGDFGGALLAQQCSMTLDDVEVTASASAHHGGGILVRDDSVADATALSVHGNQAVSDGGGVAVRTGSTFHGTEVEVVDNTARQGGGLYAGGVQTFGNVELTDSTFRGNVAQANGGAIRAYYDGDITLRRVTVAENTAAWGGGLHIVNSEVWISDSTFTANVDGRAAIDVATFGRVSLVRTSFSDNRPADVATQSDTWSPSPDRDWWCVYIEGCH